MADHTKSFSMRPVAFLVAGLAFMENLDSAILPTAAPTIARDLHLLSSQIGICITAYIVAVVCFIPVSAWLVEKYGVRPILFSSILIFVAGSLLCAISSNLATLTLMRVVQGIGASAMVPVGRLIVMQSTAKSEVVRAISYLVWPALTAPVVAPVIGGFIVSHFSWRWIFLINLPLSVIAMFFARRLVPHIAGGKNDGLDWRGFVGISISLGSLILGAAEIGAAHVDFMKAFALILVGTIVGIPTIRHLLGARRPLINLDALRIHTFRSATTTGAIFRIGHSFSPFLLPLFFQDGFHWSPSKAGGALFFYMAGNLGFKPATTPLINRFRFKVLLITTTTLSIMAMCGISALTDQTPVPVILALLFVTGCVRSMGMTLYTTLTFSDLEGASVQHANTLFSIVLEVVGICGIALAVISLKLGTNAVGATHEFSVAFGVAAFLMFMSLLGLLRLPANAGESLRN